MKKNALISVSMLLLVGLLAVQLQAQPEIIWYRTYGGDEPEECHSIIHTSDGGFALAGMTQSFEVDWMDFYLVKADVEGNEEWFNVYRKEGDNIGYDLIQTHDSGYALSGGTYYFGRDQDMGEGLLVRTDSDGEEVWTLTYNDFDIGWKSVGVVQTADSGFVVAGNFWLSEEFRQQLCAMKINADREFVWLEDYGEGSAEHHMTDFTGTADNGFAYLCSDYSLTRLDENGEIIWTQSYLDEEHSYSDILIQNSDGGFAIAGEVENYSLLFQGNAVNWYAGGAGTYLAKEGQDLGSYDVFEIDVFANGPGSGTLKIELLDDDNRNWQAEQDPSKNYIPIYDDKYVYDIKADWVGWKRMRIPLDDFVDDNPNVGDDVWNPQQGGGSGGLLQLQIICLGSTDNSQINLNLDNIYLSVSGD